MEEQDRRKYKVIRIWHVIAESKKDALKYAQEDVNSQHVSVEFAIEEIPKGFWEQLVKQIIG